MKTIIFVLMLSSVSFGQCINGVCTQPPTAYQTPVCVAGNCGLSSSASASNLGLGVQSAPASSVAASYSVAPGERLVAIDGKPVNSGFAQSSFAPQTVAGYQQAKHPAQAVAEMKASYMAQRRMSGHPLMHLNRQIPGYRFEGTGWTSGGGPAPTCTPRSRGLVLRGDATAYNGGRKYRVRIWCNS